MRLENERGEAVYYNCVMKHNLIRYQRLSGEVTTDTTHP